MKALEVKRWNSPETHGRGHRPFKYTGEYFESRHWEDTTPSSMTEGHKEEVMTLIQTQIAEKEIEQQDLDNTEMIGLDIIIQGKQLSRVYTLSLSEP